MTNYIQKEFDEHPIIDYINSINSVRGKEGMGLAIRRAVSCWLSKPIRDLTSDEVFLYPYKEVTSSEVKALKALLLKKYSRATASQTLSAIKGVMGACFELGWIDGDNLKRIERVSSVSVQPDPTVGRYIEDWEIAKLKEVLDQDETPRGARDRAIIAWLYQQGARVSDITRAKLSDWSGRSGRLIIQEGKGGKARENKLSNGALDALRVWVKVRGNWAGSLFCAIDNKGDIIKRDKPLTRYAISKMLEKRGKQAGLDPFSCHDFRRTAITDLIDKIGIRKAQIIAGHSSIETTARYDRGNKEKALRASAVRDF
jgi:integrase